MAQTVHYSTAAATTRMDISVDNAQQLQPTNSFMQHQISAKLSYPTQTSNDNKSSKSIPTSSLACAVEQPIARLAARDTAKLSNHVTQIDRSSIDKNADTEWASFTHDSEAEDTPESRRRFSESEHRNLLADVDEYDRLSEDEEDDDAGGGGCDDSGDSWASPSRRPAAAVRSPAQHAYDVTPELRAYYCKQFDKLWHIGKASEEGEEPIEDRALKGSDPHVQEFFRKSKLDQNQLSKIWSLADVNTDGYLNLQEFIAAMHLIVRCVKGHYDIPDQLPPEFRPPMMPPRLSPSRDTSSTPSSSSVRAADPHGSGFGYGSGVTPGRPSNPPVNATTAFGPSQSSYGYASALTTPQGAGSAAGCGTGPVAAAGRGSLVVQRGPSPYDAPTMFTSQPPRVAQQPKARRATPPDSAAALAGGEWSRIGAGPAAPLLSPQALNPPKGPPPRPPPRPVAQSQSTRHTRSASLDLNNTRYWQRAKSNDVVDLATKAASNQPLAGSRRDGDVFASLETPSAAQHIVNPPAMQSGVNATRSNATVSRSTQTVVADGGGDASLLIVGGGGSGDDASRDRCTAVRIANERLQRQLQRLVETRAALELALKKYARGGAN